MYDGPWTSMTAVMAGMPSGYSPASGRVQLRGVLLVLTALGVITASEVVSLATAWRDDFQAIMKGAIATSEEYVRGLDLVAMLRRALELAAAGSASDHLCIAKAAHEAKARRADSAPIVVRDITRELSTEVFDRWCDLEAQSDFNVSLTACHGWLELEQAGAHDQVLRICAARREEVLGICTAIIKPSRRQAKLHFAQLYVEKSSRRMSLGSVLVRAMARLAQRKGVRHAALGVGLRSQHSSRRFWEDRCGFDLDAWGDAVDLERLCEAARPTALREPNVMYARLACAPPTHQGVEKTGFAVPAFSSRGRPPTPLELGLAKARADCVDGDGAYGWTPPPPLHTVEVSNDGVVFLNGVQDPRFRNVYARILDSEVGSDGRVAVLILPTPVMHAAPQSAGASVRVRPQAYARVPRMLYYTHAHPIVVAWVARYATPELVAAQVVPEGFENSEAVVAVAIPQGPLLTRFYYDCQPLPSSGQSSVVAGGGPVRLMHMNAADYESGARTYPLSDATVALVEQRICEVALPPPELYLVRG